MSFESIHTHTHTHTRTQRKAQIASVVISGPRKALLAHFVCFFNLSIRSVLTFVDPSEEDLGLYTVEMNDNPNLSSSYDFTAEGKLNVGVCKAVQ